MAIQARTEFASALNQVCSERGLEPEVVIDSIKQAILAAYRKDYGETEDMEVDLDTNSGEVKLSEKGKNITPPGFGRIAAQTAKQVILQRIREAEKNAILQEYSSKIGTVVSGLVQRISGPIITVNLGKAEGIMPPQEQSHNENYAINQRMKFFVVGIKEGARGEEIIVSRSANGLLEGLFRQEVPEMASGSVEVKAIAREAGSRSKIAVASTQLGVDPVGSCVGQRGVRVQAVINELGDEKIDVIAYQEDPVEFIKAALSPAKDISVKIQEDEKIAEVTTPDDQLSLAIGKEGQNVRLAARLTGYKIDIRGKTGTPKEVEAKEKAAQEQAKKALGIEDKTATTESSEIKPENTEKEQKTAKNKGSVSSVVAREKGTEEKTSAQADQPTDDQAQASTTQVQNDQQVSDQPADQTLAPTPPADDAEPLIADQEEKKEETQAQEVAQTVTVDEAATTESTEMKSDNNEVQSNQTATSDNKDENADK